MKDLKAVVGRVYQNRKQSVVLIGYSMGTLVIEEYLKQYPHSNISEAILDGYVGNPHSFVSNMAKQGKQIELPDGYEFNDTPIDIPMLVVSAKMDSNCPKENIPSLNEKIKVVEYDCGHIMALSTFPDEYITEIHAFREHTDGSSKQKTFALDGFQYVVHRGFLPPYLVAQLVDCRLNIRGHKFQYLFLQIRQYAVMSGCAFSEQSDIE